MGFFTRKTSEERNESVARREANALKAEAKKDIRPFKTALTDTSKEVVSGYKKGVRSVTPRVGYNTGVMKKLKRLGK